MQFINKEMHDIMETSYKMRGCPRNSKINTSLPSMRQDIFWIVLKRNKLKIGDCNRSFASNACQRGDFFQLHFQYTFLIFVIGMRYTNTWLPIVDSQSHFLTIKHEFRVRFPALPWNVFFREKIRMATIIWEIQYNLCLKMFLQFHKPPVTSSG